MLFDIILLYLSVIAWVLSVVLLSGRFRMSVVLLSGRFRMSVVLLSGRERPFVEKQVVFLHNCFVVHHDLLREGEI